MTASVMDRLLSESAFPIFLAILCAISYKISKWHATQNRYWIFYGICYSLAVSGFIGYQSYDEHAPRKAGYEDVSHVVSQDPYGVEVEHDQEWIPARRGNGHPIETGAITGSIVFAAMISGILITRSSRRNMKEWGPWSSETTDASRYFNSISENIETSLGVSLDEESVKFFLNNPEMCHRLWDMLGKSMAYRSEPKWKEECDFIFHHYVKSDEFKESRPAAHAALSYVIYACDGTFMIPSRVPEYPRVRVPE